MSKNIKVGDYVLASRWSDGKLGEPWAVGFIEEIVEAHGKPRYYVGYGNGELISMAPYRRAERIKPFVGSELLRLNKEQDWERLYPFRSIWGMKKNLKKMREMNAILTKELYTQSDIKDDSR